MVPVRPGSDMQQPGGLHEMHPMPFAFRNDARITRPQFKSIACGGVHGDGHPSGKNQDELIAVRMPLAIVWWIARHVRHTNLESVDPRPRTPLVFDSLHVQIPTDR